MNAIREIIEVQNNRIILELPRRFQKTHVEVIIFPVEADEDTAAPLAHGGQENRMNFEQYFGITDIGEERIEKQLHTIRSEWDRYVSH